MIGPSAKQFFRNLANDTCRVVKSPLPLIGSAVMPFVFLSDSIYLGSDEILHGAVRGVAEAAASWAGGAVITTATTFGALLATRPFLAFANFIVSKMDSSRPPIDVLQHGGIKYYMAVYTLAAGIPGGFAVNLVSAHYFGTHLNSTKANELPHVPQTSRQSFSVKGQQYAYVIR